MKPRTCINPACRKTLASTNASYCRQCYRRGFRARPPRKPTPLAHEPLLFWQTQFPEGAVPVLKAPGTRLKATEETGDDRPAAPFSQAAA